MKKARPTYRELEERLAAAEPVIAALRRHEVDAVVGEEKIAFLLFRKVNEAWLESNGEFNAMFELGGIGMIQAVTPAFRFARVNAKFCEITGYSAEELLTHTYLDLTHPQDRNRDMKEISDVIRGNTESWSSEKRCVRKDGCVIRVGVHGVALRNRAGQAVMIMAMIEDVTTRVREEERQRKAEKHPNEQLQERAAALSEMLRSIRKQATERKPADEVLRGIRSLIDRSIGVIDGTSKKRRGKKPSEKDRKSAGGKSSD